MKAISNPTANGSSRSESRPLEDNLEERVKPRKRYISRRSFLGKTIALGAGTVGAGLLGSIRTAEASGSLSSGDAALLRFPAALELLEADFWIQYNELGGIQDDEVPGGSGNPDYTAALTVIEDEMTRTSMTTLMMRSLITSSSILIWSPRERLLQISMRFAL
jgi:hypothetical protein